MVVFTKETNLEIPASVLENHIKITIIVKIFLFVTLRHVIETNVDGGQKCLPYFFWKRKLSLAECYHCKQ